MSVPLDRRGASRVGSMLALSAAAGSAFYAAVVSALARWPSVVRARGTGGAARPILVAVVAVPLAVGGGVLSWRSRGARLATRHRVALAAVGFGAAWVAWGLFEQHVLRTFDVAPGTAAAGGWDALFHGVGVLTAGLGTSILSAGGGPGRGT